MRVVYRILMLVILRILGVVLLVLVICLFLISLIYFKHVFPLCVPVPFYLLFCLVCWNVGNSSPVLWWTNVNVNSDFLSVGSVFSSLTPSLIFDFDFIYCHIVFGLFGVIWQDYTHSLFLCFSGYWFDLIPSSRELLVYFGIFP